METNKKIKRVSYIRRNNIIIPREKIILEKLEDDCYRRTIYRWDAVSSEWLITSNSGFFDGETLHEVGSIFITKSNIDRIFEVLVKYNGYEYMRPDEVNIATKDDIEKMNKINNSMEDK